VAGWDVRTWLRERGGEVPLSLNAEHSVRQEQGVDWEKCCIAGIQTERAVPGEAEWEDPGSLFSPRSNLESYSSHANNVWEYLSLVSVARGY
jgi:hypothetical protein